MLNPSPRRSLNLDTYTGQNISNMITPDPDADLIALYKKADPLLYKGVDPPLIPPTGRYNCHGLVFASRRTWIPHPQLPVKIDDILQADGYVEVSTKSQVGDIIVYRNALGEIVHTGFVVRIELLGKTAIIFIRSKWGALGEYEHRADQSPYTECTFEYWRLQ